MMAQNTPYPRDGSIGRYRFPIECSGWAHDRQHRVGLGLGSGWVHDRQHREGLGLGSGWAHDRQHREGLGLGQDGLI